MIGTPTASMTNPQALFYLVITYKCARDPSLRSEPALERSEGMTDMISKCLVDNSTICYYLHKRATMKPFHSME